MKTKVLFLLFAMSSVALNCFAQDVPQPNNEPDAIFGGLTGDGGIKSGSVSASAYICQQVITIYIDWYAGYVDIYVEDEDGICENLYFSNSDTYMPRTSNGLYKLFEYQNI